MVIVSVESGNLMIRMESRDGKKCCSSDGEMPSQVDLNEACTGISARKGRPIPSSGQSWAEGDVNF